MGSSCQWPKDKQLSGTSNLEIMPEVLNYDGNLHNDYAISQRYYFFLALLFLLNNIDVDFLACHLT